MIICSFGVRLLFVLAAQRTIAEARSTSVRDAATTDRAEAAAAFPASPRKWLSELFVEARSLFRVHSVANSRCERDVRTYASHLKNQTVWAVRIMESSEWPTTGLFAGMTKALGNWEGCVRAEGPGIKGRYCLVRMSYDYDFVDGDGPASNVRSDREINEMSAWRVIKMFEKDVIRSSRLKLRWALCVPSSCAPHEVEMSLNETLSPLFEKHGLRARVRVEPDYCSVDEEPPYSILFYVTCCIFAAIVGTVCVVTIFDLLRKSSGAEETNISGAGSAYSLAHNLEMLSRETLPRRYRIFYFLKIAATVAVIMGHTSVFELRLATFQTEIVEEFFHPHHRLLNDSVDVFLVTSGFLLYNIHHTNAKMKGTRYVVAVVAKKWIRLGVIYGVCMLFLTNIMPHLGNGPFWKAEISKETRVCESYWWLNLLGLANIPTFQPTCILTSWFTSVFIQLTVLGGVVLTVVTKNAKTGAWFLFFVILSSTVFTFFMVYWQKYNVMILGFLKVIEDHRSMKDGYFYISTYPRVGPYFLGFAAAFLTEYLNSRKYRFTTMQKVLILMASVDVAVRFALHKATFYDVEKQYDVLENALFAAVQRSVAVLPIACILCIHFTSGLGGSWYRNIIEWEMWVPIGRLVPVVSFIHFFLMVFNTYSRRTFSPVNNLFGLIWHGICYTIYSFVVAFLLHLFLEKPLINLVKHIEEKLLERTNANSQTIDGFTEKKS